MRKTKEIEIFGKTVILSERNAQDVLNLSEFASSQEMSPTLSIQIASVALSDSLKYALKWYERKPTAKKLLESLTQKELFEFMAMILELEGVKKKVAEQEKESDGKSQDT